MLKVVFLKFWPALIPFVLYAIWLWCCRRRREEGEVGVRFGDGPFLSVVITTIMLLVGCVASYVWFDSRGNNEYVPSQYKEGIFIRGQDVKKDDE